MCTQSEAIAILGEVFERSKAVEQFNLFAEISPFYRNVINEGICYAGR